MLKSHIGWWAVIGLMATGCTSTEPQTHLHLNARAAQQALAVDGIDLTAFSMGVACESGFSAQLAGTLDATQAAVVEVPACGSAELSLTVTAASGLTALLSSATANLVPGDVHVTFAAQKVGKLSFVNDIDGSGQCRIGNGTQSPVLDVIMGTTTEIDVAATTYEVFCAENIAEATAENGDGGFRFNVLVGAGQLTTVLLSELGESSSEPWVYFVNPPPSQLAPGATSSAPTVYVGGGTVLFTPAGPEVSGFPMTVELFAEVSSTQAATLLASTSATQAGELVLPTFSIAQAGSYDLFVKVTSGALSGESERVTLQVGDIRARIIAPTSVQAGEDFSITFELLLANGQPDFSYEGADVQLQASDSCLYNEGDNQVGNGRAQLNGLRACQAGLLTLGISVLNGPSAQTTITVSPGAYYGLHMDGLPSLLPQGMDVSVTIRAGDYYTNTIAEFVGTVNVSTTDSGATLNGAGLPADLVFTAQDAGRKQVTLRFATLGGQDVALFDASAQISQPFNVQVIDETYVSHVGIVATPMGNTVAGESWQVTFEARNYLDQVLTGAVGLVSYDVYCLGQSGSLPLSAGSASTTLVMCDVPFSTIYASYPGAEYSSINVAVAPGPASSVSFSHPLPVVAPGVPFTLETYPTDDYGNEAADFGACVFGGLSSDLEAAVDFVASAVVGTSQAIDVTLNNVGYHNIQADYGDCGPSYIYLNVARPTRYVDAVLGNDTYPGTNPYSPKQSIGSAIAIAGPNEEIHIAGGIYEGALTIDKPLTLRGGFISGDDFYDRDTFDPANQTIVRASADQTTLATLSFNTAFQAGDFAELDGLTLEAPGPSVNKTTVAITAAVDVTIRGCRIATPSGSSSIGEGVRVENIGAKVLLNNNLLAVGTNGVTQIGVMLNQGDVRMAHNTIVNKPNGTNTQAGISWGMNHNIQLINNLFYGEYSCNTPPDSCAIVEGINPTWNATVSRGNAFVSTRTLYNGTSGDGFAVREGAMLYDAATYEGSLANHSNTAVYASVSTFFNDTTGPDTNIITMADNDWQLSTWSYNSIVNAQDNLCGSTGDQPCFGDGLDYYGMLRLGSDYTPGAFDIIFDP